MRQTSAEQEWFAAYEDVINRNYGGHIAAYKKAIEDAKGELEDARNRLKSRDDVIAELHAEAPKLRGTGKSEKEATVRRGGADVDMPGSASSSMLVRRGSLLPRREGSRSQAPGDGQRLSCAELQQTAGPWRSRAQAVPAAHAG